MRTYIHTDGKGDINLNEVFPLKDFSTVSACLLVTRPDGNIELTVIDHTGKTISINDIPNKNTIKYSKHLLNYVKSVTSDCWFKAQNNLFGDDPTHHPDDIDDIIRSKLDQEYRDLINKLDTPTLEAILLCHKKGKMLRKNITLESIKNELASRGLLSDITY